MSIFSFSCSFFVFFVFLVPPPRFFGCVSCGVRVSFPAVFVERVFLTRLYIYRTEPEARRKKKKALKTHGTACGGGGGGVFETETSPER